MPDISHMWAVSMGIKATLLASVRPGNNIYATGKDICVAKYCIVDGTMLLKILNYFVTLYN